MEQNLEWTLTLHCRSLKVKFPPVLNQIPQHEVVSSAINHPAMKTYWGVKA